MRRKLKAHLVRDMKELTRCGACGAFQQDPSSFSDKERDEAELVHCGCENQEESLRDQEIAGNVSLSSWGEPL